jgi:selenocysteine lyase/cysteine desulfurase
VRDAFPVLSRLAHLNAGTTGPLPAVAVDAAQVQLERERTEGRQKAHMERRGELAGELRAGYAEVLGAEIADVALTLSTSDGLVRVLAGMGLAPGDEVLTSTVEHPGLYGPLARMRRRGVRVKCAPLAELPACVTAHTRLVACSHVSWVSGEVAPVEALVATGVPLLLDGAQGVGAIPLDMGALGVAAYAGSGQKWLCGPEGTGMLWLNPTFRPRVAPFGASYTNLERPADGVLAEPWPDARAYDAPVIPAASVAAAVAALGVFRDAGWERAYARARELAAALAGQLAERGKRLLPRGETTLVSWEDEDPEGLVARAADAGVIVRSFPGRPFVRASTGAWNDERDLERLIALL